MQNIFTLFNPIRFAAAITYMVQNTDYQVAPYLSWFWRTKAFDRVMYRRQLDQTTAAGLLKIIMVLGMMLQLALGILTLILWRVNHMAGGLFFGLALIISYPILWAHLIVLPLIIGRALVVAPRQRKAIAAATHIFANSHATRIAIVGSYGKTSMKELLLTVLSQGRQVAATPANKNAAVSYAAFANTVTGKEDILLLEYGEGKPGDVMELVHLTQPTHAVITGLAPAHLDQYKTLQAVGDDIFSVAQYLNGEQVYVNGDSPSVRPFITPTYTPYSHAGALGWKVQKPVISITGTEFELIKGKQKLKLSSGLLGSHQLGPLSFAAAFALELGLSTEEVELGIGQTKPYEHRMQPYRLGDAWVIDDTYNGNIEGIRAGTSLLKTLPAQRKWYVTPGLVDQGAEAEDVHVQMGALIADANPDIVVLMQNSATKFIKTGLEQAGYVGEVRVETEPLEFYTNLAHFLSADDLVLMQNDWTDNYA